MTHHHSRFTFYAFCCTLLSFSPLIFAQNEVALKLGNASRLTLENNEKVLKAQKILDRAKGEPSNRQLRVSSTSGTHRLLRTTEE